MIREEINEQKLDRKLKHKERETKIKSKIWLIYNSKLKSNDIGREIKRKTRILTQDSAQIDLIVQRTKGYSFGDFEDNRRHLRSNFSLFSQQNLTFKYSLDKEIDLEAQGSKKFKYWDV